MRRRLEASGHIPLLCRVALFKAVSFKGEHLYDLRDLRSPFDPCIDDIALVEPALQIMLGDRIRDHLCLFKGRILYRDEIVLPEL